MKVDATLTSPWANAVQDVTRAMDEKLAWFMKVPPDERTDKFKSMARQTLSPYMQFWTDDIQEAEALITRFAAILDQHFVQEAEILVKQYILQTGTTIKPAIAVHVAQKQPVTEQVPVKAPANIPQLTKDVPMHLTGDEWVDKCVYMKD